MNSFKEHKFWGLASFACMGVAAYSAAHMDEMPSRDTHKTWGFAAFGCMAMAVMSGYLMVADREIKAQKAAESEVEPVSEEETEVPEENPETEE